MDDFRPQKSRSCWRQKDSLVEHLTIMIQRADLKFSMARQSNSGNDEKNQIKCDCPWMFIFLSI